MTLLLVGLLAGLLLGLALGSVYGIRGYKRRLSMARAALPMPLQSPVAFVRVSEDGPAVLNPLTGSDMAASAA